MRRRCFRKTKARTDVAPERNKAQWAARVSTSEATDLAGVSRATVAKVRARGPPPLFFVSIHSKGVKWACFVSIDSKGVRDLWFEVTAIGDLLARQSGTANLKLENVWQLKDLQTRFLDVWQAKDLRARFLDVWQ